MNKKRIIVASASGLFVLGSAFLLSGCGKNQDKNTDANKPSIKTQSSSQSPKQGDNSKGGSAPAEAISACQSKSEGDSCSMTMSAPQGKDGAASTSADSSKTLTGTCKKQSEQLVCTPTNMPTPPSGGGAPSQDAPAAK